MQALESKSQNLAIRRDLGERGGRERGQGRSGERRGKHNREQGEMKEKW